MDTNLSLFKLPIFLPILFMGLSFVFSHSTFHILQILCFSILFARFCLSTDGSGSILSSSARTTACIVLALDYVIWSSSRFWSKLITEIELSDSISSSQFVWCKLFSVIAFFLLCMTADDLSYSSSSTSSVSDGKGRTSLSSKLRRSLHILKVL